MNIWTVIGLMAGCAMVFLGTALGTGGTFSSNITTLSGLSGILLFGMAIGSYIRSSLKRITLAAFGAPLALIAMASLGTVSLANQPKLALAQTTAAVERGNDGHFHADVTVNGTKSVEMLVDTGASVVLLSHAHASSIGIDTAALTFDIPVVTANGGSHVAMITLASIDVGGVTLRNVETAVAKQGVLHSSLLGMSYLGALEEVVLRGNKMILKN